MTGKYVSEAELNDRAVAPRVTLEALEANIMSEHYFTAHQGARAGLLDHMVARDEQPDSKELARSLGTLPQPLRLLTFCVLVLKNGFTVTGQSSCASPENYQEDIGRRVARGDAIRQVWSLMGYQLRTQLHNLAELRSGDDRLGEALTRMTAYGLGNKEAFRSNDADYILTHFLHDQGEEGGRTYANTAREAVADAVQREVVPILAPFNTIEPEPEFNGTTWEEPQENEHLVETNELGARHPEEHDADGPVAASEAPQVQEDKE